MIDAFLFGAYPYLAIVLLLVISIQRYRSEGFTVSSLSSEFLERGRLFWGSVPFHFGVLTLLCGHLIGFLIPRQVQVFASAPLRLLVLEGTALTAGLLFFVGLVVLLFRRLASARIQRVTSPVDLVVLLLLLFEAVTGLYTALYLRWGSAWYVQVAVPYVRSLFVLRPQIQLMTSLPWMVRLHVLGAFTLFAVFAFTRLMHVLVAPLPYLWRRTQIVIWNRERRPS